MKLAIIGGWILGLSAIAFLVNVRSATGWITLVGLALLPPLILLRLWRHPAQTTSESIREAIR